MIRDALDAIISVEDGMELNKMIDDVVGKKSCWNG
jgi:hypothetical protein